LGGFLTEAGGWEAIFWLLFALGAAMVTIMFFFMEESYRDEELYQKPQEITLGDESGTPDTDDATITFKRSKKMNLLAPLVSNGGIVDTSPIALAHPYFMFRLFYDTHLF
jgi:hypothetical protein